MMMLPVRSIVGRVVDLLFNSMLESRPSLVHCVLVQFSLTLSSAIVCACPYSSNIGLSAMTLYYPVQDKTATRPVNTQNYYTKI